MNARQLVAYLAVAGAMLMNDDAAAANLIRNGSFELTPCVTPCNQDQGFLPSEWFAPSYSPDTYSNNGSYGLAPDSYGNFIGVTAQDGIRWVAGWSEASEIIGQVLTAPLVPGTSYTLGAYLRQAVRPDLAFPGTYQIELWSSTSLDASKIVVGRLGAATTSAAAWQPRSLTFTAPPQAATYPIVAFRPLNTGARDTYPGLDNVTLVATSTNSCSAGGSTATVLIDGCDSGVRNIVVSGSCLANLLSACKGGGDEDDDNNNDNDNNKEASKKDGGKQSSKEDSDDEGSKNHGQYVSCVAHLTNDWVKAGILTGQQKGRIQSCAAQSK